MNLPALQAKHTPRALWRTFLQGDGLTQEEEAELDAYFTQFLPPGPCINCGSTQGGDILSAAFGVARFRWGLAHGEGFCSTRGCGYPARAYHVDVGPIKRLTMILQYHPDDLKHEEAEDD